MAVCFLNIRREEKMKKFLNLGLAIIMVVMMLPVGMLNVSAADTTPMVALGVKFSAALKSDGTAWFWGNNSNGQIGDGTNITVKTPKKIIDDVVYIALGYSHSAVIKKDGSLWMWGNNENGQIGDGTKIDVKTPKKILDDVADVSVGDFHSAAVKKDGSLWMWGGDNIYGELGDVKNNDTTIPQYVTNDVKMVSVGRFHSTYVKKDGSLWLTGNLGSVTCNSPKKQLTNVKKISSEVYASMAIRNDNTLWACGYNYSNRIIQDDSSNSPSEYTKIMDGIVDADFGSVNGAAIKIDNSLWTWGNNEYGQIGNGSASKENIKATKIMTDVESVVTRENNMAAVKTDGSLWIWGDNRNGQIGDGSTTVKNSPTRIMNLNAGLVVEGEGTIQPNSETVLKAIRYDEDGNIAPEGGITWSCSNEDIAQITPNGNSITVKGLKGGKATITATHSATGVVADFEIEVVSYVMTLSGGYTALIDEDLPIEYAVKQGEEYVHNDLDIDWEIEQEGSNKAVKIVSDKEDPYVKTLTVKGLNVGECELVAKVNGTEIGRTKVEVLGNLAETIDNETILRAKILVDNSQYKYYKNYNSVHGIFADSLDLDSKVYTYTLKNYMDIFCDSILEDKSPAEVSAIEFYECVLVKLLNDDENAEVYGKAGEIMSDYILKYGKSLAEKGTKLEGKDKEKIKKLCKELCGDGTKNVGWIDTLLISTSSIEDFFEQYAKVYQLSNCTDAQISAVEQIRSATSDPALKTACDNVISSIKQSQSDTANYAVSSGMNETAEGLAKYAFKKMIGALEKLSPILKVANLVEDISEPVDKLLFKYGDIETDTINIYSLIVIESALKDAMANAEKSFSNNPTADKAEKLMAVADFYKNVQLYGCDLCDSVLQHQKTQNQNKKIIQIILLLKKAEFNMGDVIDLAFNELDYETNRLTVSNIKKLINSADFYSTEGTDIAEYIREVKSTTPSQWVIEQDVIKKATDYNILPDYMQNNYQNNITRAEFCTLLTWLLESKSDKSVDTLIAEKGTPIKSPFEDTYYEYADYMYKLGIVNGVGDDKFEPLGEITREQAATMIMRATDVLGYDTKNNGTADSGVSSWAQSGVGFVTENGIMNGTGNGFEPQGKYTKEQAIATFVRMFENLN